MALLNPGRKDAGPRGTAARYAGTAAKKRRAAAIYSEPPTYWRHAARPVYANKLRRAWA